MNNVAAIEAARARRTTAAASRMVRWEWMEKEVLSKVATAMHTRVRVATELLRSQIVLNISRPVTKTVYKRYYRDQETGRLRSRQRTVVTNRSKRGEFPKADTTMLLKGIFTNVWESSPNVWDGGVGTPLDYGAILETSEQLDRPFLTKTLYQMRDRITGILAGPLK